MSTAYKPEGHTSVSPYLVVDGAASTIEFLKRVFDATELMRIPAPGDTVMHAAVRIDDSVVMLADGGQHFPPIPAHVHVYVRDVDATYRRALDAGALSVQEPVKKDDPDKRGGVRDAGGTTWWIGTKVERAASRRAPSAAPRQRISPGSQARGSATTAPIASRSTGARSPATRWSACCAG